MTRRLGRLAERMFAQLCAEYGAVCNESTEDENGWDYIVEFPAETDARLPADLLPAQKTALVQVKATEGKPGLFSSLM